MASPTLGNYEKVCALAANARLLLLGGSRASAFEPASNKLAWSLASPSHCLALSGERWAAVCSVGRTAARPKLRERLTEAGRRCNWMRALLALALLVTGCATDSWQLAEPPPQSELQRPFLAQELEPAAEVHKEERVFGSLPSHFAAVQVGQREFALALVDLMVSVRLPVASPLPALKPGLWLAMNYGSPENTRLVHSYQRWCGLRGSAGDCLGRLQDGPTLDASDKRSIALALAAGPALEGARAEVRGMLDPVKVMATLSISAAAYLSLLVAPEPVSKGVALLFGALLWGYLGWEVFELYEAWERLSEECERATTFEQLREAGERFARTLGPNSVRILVLVGTAAVGETAAAVSRARRLPGVGEASRRTAEAGAELLELGTAAERMLVSTPQVSPVAAGSVRVVVPPTATPMAAQQGAQGARLLGQAGRLLAHGHRAFRSFSSFKRAMGRAGKGFEWHHIVEQTSGNVTRFGPEALHNTENVVRLEQALHQGLNRLYSSIRADITSSRTMTVRRWLSTQSYEAQRQFGLQAIENLRRGIW